MLLVFGATTAQRLERMRTKTFYNIVNRNLKERHPDQLPDKFYYDWIKYPMRETQFKMTDRIDLAAEIFREKFYPHGGANHRGQWRVVQALDCIDKAPPLTVVVIDHPSQGLASACLYRYLETLLRLAEHRDIGIFTFRKEVVDWGISSTVLSKIGVHVFLDGHPLRYDEERRNLT